MCSMVLSIYVRTSWVHIRQVRTNTSLVSVKKNRNVYYICSMFGFMYTKKRREKNSSNYFIILNTSKARAYLYFYENIFRQIFVRAQKYDCTNIRRVYIIIYCVIRGKEREKKISNKTPPSTYNNIIKQMRQFILLCIIIFDTDLSVHCATCPYKLYIVFLSIHICVIVRMYI